MKIAVVSDDKKTIAHHFGRARGFLVYDVDAEQLKHRKYRPNTFTGHARGREDADHQADRHGPILAALKDCAAVISHGMGQRIYRDLRQAGIEAIITDETDAEQALRLYLKGELKDRPERGCQHDH